MGDPVKSRYAILAASPAAMWSDLEAEARLGVRWLRVLTHPWNRRRLREDSVAFPTAQDHVAYGHSRFGCARWWRAELAGQASDIYEEHLPILAHYKRAI